MPISEVYNIDNMEYMKSIPNGYFDLAIVDPPYGLGDSVVNSGGRFKRYHNKNGNWDNEIPTDEYFSELFRISKNQIIWGGNYFSLPPNKCFVIWDKLQPEGISFAMAEYAWCSFNSVAKIFRHRTQGQEKRFHPTQKPVELYKWLLKNFAECSECSGSGEVPSLTIDCDVQTCGKCKGIEVKIFDSHMGSQSSRIAAYDMGFSYYGCELDKDYFEAGNKRFELFKSQMKLF